MKKPITTIFFVISTMLFGQAQTVDEIINKHIVAMGGKEKMMSLKTVRMTASAMGNNGGESNLLYFKKHMVGFRQEQTANGITTIRVVTQKKGWRFTSTAKTPKELQGDEFPAGKNQIDLQGPFVNYKEKGTKIESEGKERLDGTTCYKLKVTFKDGIELSYFIDVKTNFIYKISYKKTYAYTFTNYKKNAAGYWFPYNTKNIRGGTASYQKIETNVAVDDKLFEVDEGVF